MNSVSHRYRYLMLLPLFALFDAAHATAAENLCLAHDEILLQNKFESVGSQVKIVLILVSFTNLV